jgi:hypothetical protein
MVTMQAPSLEEAKQIAAPDPILQSGRLALEIHPAFFAGRIGNKGRVLEPVGPRQRRELALLSAKQLH